jgi:hypothetical protein
MNLQPLSQGPRNVQAANKNGQSWLIIGLLATMALIIMSASAAGHTAMASAAHNQAAPSVINSRLYVPCSVSACDPAPTVINSRLYVPCSVSGCDLTEIASRARGTK